jgi:SAM-dependent methyltransferase
MILVWRSHGIKDFCRLHAGWLLTGFRRGNENNFRIGLQAQERLGGMTRPVSAHPGVEGNLVAKKEYEKMARVEQEHWWYRSLHHLVLNSIRRNTAGKDISIIDAGCGTGGLMLYLRQRGYSNMRGFDLSPHAVGICHERGLNVTEGDLRSIREHFTLSSADVIVSNDTFCFFRGEECADLMRQFFQVLQPGGLLILNVPALKAFRGIHDLSVGIRRRFSRPGFHALIDPDQFHVVRELFWPFLLSPMIYCVRLSQRIKMKLKRDYEIGSDIDLPNPWFNRVLEGMTQFENRWLPAKPFGSSLYLVLKAKAA